MSDLEELKKKKLQEMQQATAQQEQVKAQVAQLEQMVKAHLSKQAAERYANLRLAHQQKALQLLQVLGQMIQQGHITSNISDEQLKEVLIKLEPQKRDIKIKRV